MTTPSGRASAAVDADQVGARLRPWRPGGLDIHHIATGRGDATLVIGPDGSSLMIDAGATSGAAPPALAIRPSGERRAGEWIGRYARRRLADVGADGLDVFLATHQHPDHIGDLTPEAPASRDGRYRLTGVSDVDALAPIRRLVDRGFPDYDQPARNDAAFQRNYEAFVRARLADGRPVERLRAGALNQLRASRGVGTFPGFEVRNLAVNGEVWTGQGEHAQRLFPDVGRLPPTDVPEENVWSAAVRIRYGAFAYYTAGDLTCSTLDDPTLAWRDVGTAAARAAGRVDIAVTPHHGMYDGLSAESVRALAPRAWIIPGWHALHPSLSVLERLFNQRIYPASREVFATSLADATAAASPWLTPRLASREGHVIARVEASGEFRIVVTDNRDEDDRVESVSGPFAPRS